MGQKKLIKFAAIKEYENVLEYPQDMQGKWAAFFNELGKATSPIDIATNKALTLELACGRGEYAVGLGRMFPTQNFIGVDLKGNRIWKGASIANKEGLKNIAFVRTQIELTPNYFAKDEVDEIWITFPDPQLRWSKAKKRLTHPKFLRLYQQFLFGGDGSNKESRNNRSISGDGNNGLGAGIVHLKTDSPLLYNFTLKVIELYGLNLIYKTENLYAEPTIDPRCLIKTYYEGLDIAQSNKIHYIQFNIDKELPIALDDVLKEAIKDIPMDAGELLRMEAEAAREKKEQ
ncbi:MAG: tRNA (guanosine(46)-N7)-methyltransferase TrmB [Sediminibacterium sp.]|nr:tRNA (guanosine(46)-N7)-methyltransferase TrmB [Sediminibacterium sp.]MBP6144654.1 tRNA (guanosine(46)-N7)-methyltransferase TrmB [Sediminibacterium sp.]